MLTTQIIYKSGFQDTYEYHCTGIILVYNYIYRQGYFIPATYLSFIEMSQPNTWTAIPCLARGSPAPQIVCNPLKTNQQKIIQNVFTFYHTLFFIKLKLVL